MYHIGFDDTDSSEGMCTTFLCYELVKYLLEDRNVKILDYPNLIRLNPNIPWKTRGNAALALRISSELSRETIFETCSSFLEKYSTSPKANSGLALFEGYEVPLQIQDFAQRALYSILSVRKAIEIAENFGMLYLGMRSMQGLVGAVSAIGNILAGDHTYELIAYRKSLDVARKISKSKIIDMSNSTFPNTFSSYDPKYGRVMITPHGPDPVLCGIRGETALDVLNAFRSLTPIENLRGYAIFRSNQGTGEHLRNALGPGSLKAFSSGTVTGVLSSRPRIDRGGHAYFVISNDEGEIPCACYEPTGEFRKVALALIPGDVLEVGGGVRKSTSVHPKILNVEFLKPVKLAKKVRLSNPKCESCGARMTSRGKNQGYECRRCGFASKSAKKSEEIQIRELQLQTYIPPIKAHRHLTKPLQRFELRHDKQRVFPAKLIDCWIE
jgi:tRNA(Ile2)-agmatinylcytidine synthase